ncbi:MAG: GNAT family N-acetyltransferase [Gammaproteobacteria bacterium]|nr:GNAT family N-acetyltransferase [Gammaproteobacteria bacterium]
MTMMQPKTLTGQYVRLEPLTEAHHDGLCKAIADGKLWKLFVTLVPRLEDVSGFIRQAVNEQESGLSLVFATMDIATSKVVGSTRFMKADFTHKRLEVGHTFIAKSHQRSRINTEAKLLMLKHAFEVLGMNRVELLTDYLNQSSRRAILRLGAKEEGTLRNHMIMPDGRVRDSVLYSIIANEWPGVKTNLENKLR